MKRRRVARFAAVAAGITFGVVTGCKPVRSFTEQSTPNNNAAPAPATYDASTSPSRKEIIRVLLKDGGFPLSGHPSCSGVGTDPNDTDLIDFLSGFIAEQDKPDGGNWIEATASPTQEVNEERLWQSHVVIRHAQGDDVWGWGVSYQMRGRDHSIVPGSIRCTGSG
jgi:hypothetical protein